jgi:hypothetical protein
VLYTLPYQLRVAASFLDVLLDACLHLGMIFRVFSMIFQNGD